VKTTPMNLNKGCVYDKIEVDIDFHNDWHTFGVSFTPEAITWFIDSVPQITEYRYFTKSQVTEPFNMSKDIYKPVCLADYCFGNLTETLYEQVNFPRGDIDMGVIINNNHRSLIDYNWTRWIDEQPNWPEGYLEVDYFRYYKFTSCNKDASFCKSQPQDFNSFSVYPNPSTGRLSISTEDNLLLKHINIINNLGMILFSDSFISKEHDLTLDVPPGLYYIQLSCNGKSECRKVVIE
ncbi:MAG: T9SS type A sorting domain-containing protein, partial [Bacteroidia bacterium]